MLELGLLRYGAVLDPVWPHLAFHVAYTCTRHFVDVPAGASLVSTGFFAGTLKSTTGGIQAEAGAKPGFVWLHCHILSCTGFMCWCAHHLPRPSAGILARGPFPLPPATAITTRSRYLCAGDVNGCAFGPDHHTLVTGCSDKLVRVWDTRQGARVAELAGHTGAVMAVAVTRDGK